MTIDISQFGAVVAALMIVGAIFKHAFPRFPKRFIPLVTLVLGIVSYLTLTDGWNDPHSFIEALIASATATGIHSGIKNVYQEIENPSK